MLKPLPRLRLQGFNNLTKALSFNIYHVSYARTEDERHRYVQYIDEAYNADRLAGILVEVADIIGANVLNIAKQDYDPQGASVTMLISEEPIANPSPTGHRPVAETALGHLDKSHITVHTYPEIHPGNGIATFRADVDVATCGLISPLKALNYLIETFESDIVVVDYRVRGFTRDVRGQKHYIDHKINSIQDFLSRDFLQRYQHIDVNVRQENMFMTKMRLREFDLDAHLFDATAAVLGFRERIAIENKLRWEIEELYLGRAMLR
ncbi:adenosylmethionine decarboxylase [Lysobacter rhizosphaerae]